MTKDLTCGNPGSVLIKFTLPMFVGVIFQQLYNIADSVIAGHFVGEDALAAVGASYPITMIFMSIAIGFQSGCSVVISHFFGAKDYKAVKTCISTSLIMSLALSLMLTATGFAISTPLMKLVKTPANIFEDGQLYLNIYILGFGFVFLYNVTTGIFNSLGDSRTPLVFLIGSSVGNILLDLLLVIAFDMGVAGVAWATFIAQGIACILSLIVLLVRVRGIKSEQRPNLISFGAMKSISSIAVPSIFQMSFVSVGNMFVQSLVNSFGSSVIAGYSAAIKLNTFAVTSFSTMSNSVSSFTAQNLGGKMPERVTKGFSAGLKLGLSLAAVFFAIYFIFPKYVLGIFMDDDATALALKTGTEFLRIVSPFYFFVCTKVICDGVLKGSGCMLQFMLATFTDLLLRVVLAFVLSGFWGAVGIWRAWPVSWAIATVMSYLFYKKGSWKKGYYQ